MYYSLLELYLLDSDKCWLKVFSPLKTDLSITIIILSISSITLYIIIETVSIGIY